MLGHRFLERWRSVRKVNLNRPTYMQCEPILVWHDLPEIRDDKWVHYVGKVHVKNRVFMARGRCAACVQSSHRAIEASLKTRL
jgi:hypothetical protein